MRHLWGHFYVFIRTDLPIAQQTVQAVHAAYEAGIKFGIKKDGIDSVVICQVKSEQELELISTKLDYKETPFVEFYEPDIGNQLTSIATGALQNGQRKHLSKYKLWGG